MKNYYEILQVSNKADKDTISKVYKYLIKKNHPDLFSGEEKKQAEIKAKLKALRMEQKRDSKGRKKKSKKKKRR